MKSKIEKNYFFPQINHMKIVDCIFWNEQQQKNATLSEQTFLTNFYFFIHNNSLKNDFRYKNTLFFTRFLPLLGGQVYILRLLLNRRPYYNIHWIEWVIWKLQITLNICIHALILDKKTKTWNREKKREEEST